MENRRKFDEKFRNGKLIFFEIKTLLKTSFTKLKTFVQETSLALSLGNFAQHETCDHLFTFCDQIIDVILSKKNIFDTYGELCT